MRPPNLKVLIYLWTVLLLIVFSHPLRAENLEDARVFYSGHPVHQLFHVSSGNGNANNYGMIAGKDGLSSVALGISDIGNGLSLKPHPVEPGDFVFLFVPIVLFIGIKWFREGFEIYRNHEKKERPEELSAIEKGDGLDMTGTWGHIEQSGGEQVIPGIQESPDVSDRRGRVA